jgi:glycosyltransferase involved in cell wall biosynthesis
MVIGIDASRANQAQKTGTEWYSFYLIQKLKEIIPEEYKVILYSKEKLRGGLEDLPKNWQSKVLNWPIKFLWTQLRFSLAMLKFWSRPDLLFVPAHTIPVIHPKKTVLVAHDIGFEKYPDLYSDKKIGPSHATELDYHRWAMRFAVRHAHHIITVSQFSKKEIIDFYHYPKDKISVVHNGFANNSYFPLTLEERKNSVQILNKYNLKIPYFLFIGRLEYKKNIPRLIEAYNILKNKYKIQHKLVLIGSKSFKYELIENKINKYQLKTDIIEPGYVEQEDMNIIMNFADLFVLPSQYEGFGIPVLEAMAAGTAVVCSNIPPLKEIAGLAANYFNPHDENEIAKIIYETLNNKEYLIKEGFICAKKYSYQKCAENIWNILHNIIICKNS